MFLGRSREGGGKGREKADAITGTTRGALAKASPLKAEEEGKKAARRFRHRRKKRKKEKKRERSGFATPSRNTSLRRPKRADGAPLGGKKRKEKKRRTLPIDNSFKGKRKEEASSAA